MLLDNTKLLKTTCWSLTFFLSSFCVSQASDFSPEDLQAALAGLAAIQEHEPEVEAQRPPMAAIVSLADLERFKVKAISMEAGSATAALREEWEARPNLASIVTMANIKNFQKTAKKVEAGSATVEARSQRPRTSSALLRDIKKGPSLSSQTEQVERPKATFRYLSEYYSQASRDLLVGFRRDEYIAGNLMELRLDGRRTGGYEITEGDLERVGALIEAQGGNRNEVIADLRKASRALSQRLQDEKESKKAIILNVAKRGEEDQTLSEQLLTAPQGKVPSFVMAQRTEASAAATAFTTVAAPSEGEEDEPLAAMTRSMSMMFDTAPAIASSDVVGDEPPASMTRSMSMMFDVPIEADAALASASATGALDVSHSTQMSLDNTYISVQEKGTWEDRSKVEGREATDTLPAKAAQEAYRFFILGSVKRVKATEETVLPSLFYTVDESVKKGWAYNTYIMDVGIVGKEAGYIFVDQAEEIGVPSDKKVETSRAYNVLHKEETIFSTSKAEKVRY